MRKTSSAGLTLIKSFEGLALTAYYCPAGILTIGYGHTAAAGDPKVMPGMKVSKTEAESILKADLNSYEAAVNGAVKVPLTQSQFDALVSFVYNVGAGAFKKSTLLRRLNAGHYGDVPAQLMRWTKANGKELAGLVRRRRAEAALWRALDETKEIPAEETRAVPEAPVPAKTILQSKEANTAVAVGVTSTVAVLTEVLPAVEKSATVLGGVKAALGEPATIILVFIAIAAVGIWYWRNQRLKDTDQ